jgi:hypothetical protein
VLVSALHLAHGSHLSLVNFTRERVMSLTRAVAASFVAMSVVVGHSWLAQAQQQQGPPPQRITVTTTQLIPSQVAAYRDLVQKEGIPAFKKAGIPWRWVFQSGPLGGQAFTVVTVTPVMNYAQFDQQGPIVRALGAEAAQKYNSRLNATIERSDTVVYQLIQNASIQSFSGKPPTIARVSTMTLLPGKGQEFNQLTANEWVPAMKKAGVEDYHVWTTTYGGPANTRTIVMFPPNYAALDGPGPLAKAGTQQEIQALNQKRGALVASTTNTVIRFVPELSYGAPAKPGAPSSQP